VLSRRCNGPGRRRCARASSFTAAASELSPAPVIADALGYHNKHVAKVWTEAGGTRKTYVAGDHSK
jgi:hypothetical protein